MDLQDSMFLWIPNFSESQSELDNSIQKVTLANGAILDFCDNVISLEETLEIIFDCGADVDEYLAQLDRTVTAFGA